MGRIRVIKRIKVERIDANILPIHRKKLEKEISKKASKGQRLTISDIIREELDGRYQTKIKNQPV